MRACIAVVVLFLCSILFGYIFFSPIFLLDLLFGGTFPRDALFVPAIGPLIGLLGAVIFNREEVVEVYRSFRALVDFLL